MDTSEPSSMGDSSPKTTSFKSKLSAGQIAGGLVLGCVAIAITAFFQGDVISPRPGGESSSEQLDNSDEANAKSLYSLDSDAALKRVSLLAVGIWTYTEPLSPGYTCFGCWKRFEIRSDLQVSVQSARPTDDNWGKAEPGRLIPLTWKESNTGYRKYGWQIVTEGNPSVTIYGDPINLFTVDQSGKVFYREIGQAPTLLIKHQDDFPFSK